MFLEECLKKEPRTYNSPQLSKKLESVGAARRRHRNVKPQLYSLQVRREMEELLQQFQPDPQQNPAQLTLKKKLQKLWHKYGTNLLHCYDIPGLPPDNLKMETMFSNLRRHQRRISGLLESAS